MKIMDCCFIPILLFSFLFFPVLFLSGHEIHKRKRKWRLVEIDKPPRNKRPKKIVLICSTIRHCYATHKQKLQYKLRTRVRTKWEGIGYMTIYENIYTWSPIWRYLLQLMVVCRLTDQLEKNGVANNTYVNKQFRLEIFSSFFQFTQNETIAI